VQEIDELNEKTAWLFAGELINLDAETGGYHLQIAYSTGWLAGMNVRIAE